MIYTVTLNPALDREYTVPDLAHDTVLRASETRVDAGGKGFNVSRAIKALGGNSVAIGFAGGKTGEILHEALTGLGITTDFVWVSEETRTNTSIVSETDGHYVKANESGPAIKASELEKMLAKVSTLVQKGDFWILAGSLPKRVQKDVYAIMTRLIQHAGGHVILDASGDALTHGLGANPFIIKPNDEEAIAVTGATSAETAADALRASGAQTVLVSLGKKGVLVVDEQKRTHIPAPVITQRNPIGAGDAFVGGTVFGLANKLPLREAVRWGMASGAVAASKYGTAVGSREEVELMLASVEVVNEA